MATTVTDDWVSEHTLENTTGIAANTLFGGNVSSEAADTIHAQGTNSIGVRVSGTGVAGLTMDVGAATDVEDQHVVVWGFTMQDYDTDANDGVNICFGDGTTGGGANNMGCITAGGGDTNIGPKNNFHSWCVDAHRPFNSHINNTPPALSSIRSVTFLWDFLTSNGRISAFVDEVKRGTKMIFTGGTSGVPGNSIDVAANDSTNGIGLFQDIGGIFFILGGVEIGDITNVISHFTDSGKVWNFEDQHVSASFHKITFVGHVTPVNAATFGTEVGTGITASGSGGNIFQAGGVIPFRIEALDSNITVGLFGCQMINAIAVFEDPCRRIIVEDVSVSGFSDETRSGNATTSTAAFPTPPQVDDTCDFASHERFQHITLDMQTIGVGTYTLSWEYSIGGTSWAPLTDVTDGSGNMKTSGVNTLTFAIPDDWVKGTVNGTSMYWIKAKRDAGTMTTTPRIRNARVGLGGGLRAEQANFTAVSGTWTNMDTVRVRNGAILRKITLVNSIAPIKGGALDLGPTDPATDTVRDITIIGAISGMILKDHTRFFNAAVAVNKGAGKVGIPDTAHGFPTGQSITIAGTTNYNGTFTVDATSSANEIVITASYIAETFAITDSAVPNATYNLRNFQFAGNTKDIRVDFPATSTITLNLLEGTSSDGGALVAGDIDNVNTSTVNLVANTSITFTGMKDNTEIRIYDSGTGVEIAGIEDATAGTTDDRTFVWSDSAGNIVDYVIHNWQPDVPVYQTIRVNGFTIPSVDVSVAIQQVLERNTA